MPTLHAILLRLLGASLLVVSGASTQAQVQRAFVNPGFELPLVGSRATAYFNTAMATRSSHIMLDQTEVIGWKTTHPLIPNGCSATVYPPPGYSCNTIELWYNNAYGVPPAEGRVLAELNAYAGSKLYQDICLAPGDLMSFSFGHRGRVGVDTAAFSLTAQTLLTFQTGVTTGIVGTITSTGTSVSGASAVVQADGWTSYSGVFAYSGPAQVQQVGFQAIATATGDLAAGNFIDNVTVSLKPYLELVGTPTFSVEGNAMAQVPRMRLVGRFTAPLPVTMTFSSGEAHWGSDYSFADTPTLTGVAVTAYNAALRSGTLTFNVAPGHYSDDSNNSLLNLPLQILDDPAIENNEVITFGLPSSPAYAYQVSSTMACGAAGVNATTHTIIDNDVQLRATKSVSAPTAAAGATLGYTVTFANMTPASSTSVAPLTAHDVTGVNINDSIPANATLTHWGCTASGGASCPAVSGSGAISATVALPVGGSLQFTISATAGSACTSITNTAQISLGTATLQPANGAFPTGSVAQGATLQGSPGFVVHPLTASVTTLRTCTSLGITKTNAESAVTAGGTTSYSITVTNSGAVAADGAVLHDTPSVGLACTSATCNGSGGATCPADPPAALASALLGPSGVTLPGFPGNSSMTFQLRCDVTATGT